MSKEGDIVKAFIAKKPRAENTYFLVRDKCLIQKPNKVIAKFVSSSIIQMSKDLKAKTIGMKNQMEKAGFVVELVERL